MSGYDIDRTLADWFEADALAPEPADGVERALAGARQRSSRPAWLAGPGSHWIGDSAGPVSGVATLGRTGLRTSMALLLLLLLLALVAGAVLVGAGLLRPAPLTVPLAAGPIVLEVGDRVVVYADGRVIWGPDEWGGHLEQRLTPEGVEWLLSRVISTGLFERHLLASGTDVVSLGYIKVLRGDRPVILAWGRTPEADVSGLGLEERFVRASSAQAAEAIELYNFLRDPTTWALTDDMYAQREMTPFVPSYLWVSYDRGRPDWSQLPSPAREVVTRIIGPGFMDRCEYISFDQAREIAQALAQAGVPADNDDRLGLSFHYDDRLGLSISLPSPPSFVHAHPALPHDVGTVCGEQ